MNKMVAPLEVKLHKPVVIWDDAFLSLKAVVPLFVLPLCIPFMVNELIKIMELLL